MPIGIRVVSLLACLYPPPQRKTDPERAGRKKTSQEEISWQDNHCQRQIGSSRGYV